MTATFRTKPPKQFTVEGRLYRVTKMKKLKKGWKAEVERTK